MKQFEQLAAKLNVFGLTEKEARVFVAALFLGAAPVQKIAEHAEVNRATTYVILEKLVELGLVSQTKEGRKTRFVAEGVEALARMVHRQENEVRVKQQALNGVVAELEGIRRVAAPRAPVVRFYKGEEGIRAINAYAMRNANPHTKIYAMSNYDEVLKVLPDILEENPRQRLKRGLASKVFYSYAKGALPAGPEFLREARRLSKPVSADVALWEDVMTVATYGGKDSVGIIIESPQIVSAFRQLFDLAWAKEGAAVRES